MRPLDGRSSQQRRCRRGRRPRCGGGRAGRPSRSGRAAEDHEGDGEVLERGGPHGDEDQSAGPGPAPRRSAAHAAAARCRHRELGEDDDEDEEVVYGQALLHQPRRVVLGAEVGPRLHPDDDTKSDRHTDVEERPERRLTHRDVVRITPDDEVDNKQDQRQ